MAREIDRCGCFGRTPGPRLRWLATAVAIAGIESGCDGWLPETPAPRAASDEAEEAPSPPAGDTPQARLAAARQRYKGASRKVAEDPGNPPIRCRVDGSVGYMRRNDCLVRGGTPL